MSRQTRPIEFKRRVRFAFSGRRKPEAGRRLSVLSKFCGQATKGARWMPWQKQAMKDVASCDKLRGAAHRRYIRRSPNGETHLSKPQEHPAEYIGRSERTQGSEPSQYLEEEKET